jgi:hypothetical protein
MSNGGDRRAHDSVPGEESRTEHHLPQVLAAQRVGADQEGPQIRERPLHRVGSRADAGLPDPGDAFVRVDDHDQRGAAGVRHLENCDVRDLHRSLRIRCAIRTQDKLEPTRRRVTSPLNLVRPRIVTAAIASPSEAPDCASPTRSARMTESDHAAAWDGLWRSRVAVFDAWGTLAVASQAVVSLLSAGGSLT